MDRSQKSKRVSWPSDLNLCQVIPFSLEDPPSKVRMDSRNHLQTSTLRPVNGNELDLPPGFEHIHHAKRVKLSKIPLTIWRCPPKFELNPVWKMVAGEESQETQAQKQREKRVLEAVYPRPSAIPPNPSGLKDAEVTIDDDENIPLVPFTHLDPSLLVFIFSHLSHLSSATSSQFNLDKIDHELLLRILTNPEMVEQLTMVNTSVSAQNMPSTTTDPNLNILSKCSLNSIETNINQTGSMVKDDSYYKSLIQKFGGAGETNKEVPQSCPQFNFKKKEDELRSTRKIMKPCSYFNSSKGCRKGDNCAYRHDIMTGKRRLDGVSVDQSMKRVKLGIGINAGA